ncbi:cysteine--tRNA ligase [Stomatohabitans albus]|uniref:cysteine--tRNA ligase n=1 Tax=Stomatohabitans albus TaxID=3110766 RepID=UPI00300D455F
MRLFNTLTRQVEPLIPEAVQNGERPFGMYSCGPTVQGPAHFGHARAALIPDVIRRVLEHRGIPVLHLRNITDVDDKIIAVGQEEGIDPAQVAEHFSRIFHRELKRLNTLEPHIEPRATGHLIQMIDMIRTLIDKGHAYAVDGDVFFRVRTKADYGKLSGRNVDDMVAGARIAPDERKEDPADFALWKSAKPGEPAWQSPWGLGRPGWHIECSAMATHYLGRGLDLHTGGNDLIFPHHENEIAQAEAATGHEPFSRHWLHNGMLNIDGEKMSKSLGNFITLAEALDQYSGPVLRLYYLQHHYRSPVNFAGERLGETIQAWNRVQTFVRNARGVVLEGVEPDPALMKAADDAFDDDLNTPQVVSVMFDAVREGNKALANEDVSLVATYLATVDGLAFQLGLDLSAGQDRVDDDTHLADLVEGLLAMRAAAKAEKNFGLADQIRNLLDGANIHIEDRRDGTSWKAR